MGLLVGASHVQHRICVMQAMLGVGWADRHRMRAQPGQHEGCQPRKSRSPADESTTSAGGCALQPPHNAGQVMTRGNWSWPLWQDSACMHPDHPGYSSATQLCHAGTRCTCHLIQLCRAGQRGSSGQGRAALPGVHSGPGGPRLRPSPGPSPSAGSPLPDQHPVLALLPPAAAGLWQVGSQSWDSKDG